MPTQALKFGAQHSEAHEEGGTTQKHVIKAFRFVDMAHCKDVKVYYESQRGAQISCDNKTAYIGSFVDRTTRDDLSPM